MRLVDEIRETAGRAEPPKPNEVESKYVLDCLNMEDEGSGMLFASLLENKLLYAHANTCWYVWRGHAWVRDKTSMTLGLVRYVTDRIGVEIKALEEKIETSKRENDPEDHETFSKAWKRKINLLQKKVKSLQQDKGRNSCVKFAYSYLNNPFAIEGDEFDKDPWLLGVRNGVIDLRSGELYPGKPGQMISKQCSCDYNTLDNCQMSEWQDFVAAIFNDDEDLIEFMQRLMGYGITGMTNIHVFPFLLGRGRNGKSLFVTTIMRVLNDYAAKIPSELFLKSNQPRSANQTDPGIMKLEGLRFALANEVEEGSRLSEKEINRITGGDVLEGRNPYDKELRNFTPTHLSMVVGNHEPIPPHGADGFWDRTYLIQFPVRFVKEDPDPDNCERLADPGIEEKLLEMDEQVLCWLVEGCMKWQANDMKLDPPASVLKATDDYKEDANWIGQFLDACCTRETEETSSATTLFVAFEIWYRENINSNKTRTPSQRAFGSKLKARRDIEWDRNTAGIYYKGIKLNAEWSGKMLEEAMGKESTRSQGQFQ